MFNEGKPSSLDAQKILENSVTTTYSTFEAEISKAEKLNKILEWLYVSDRNLGSSGEWRKEFIKMLNEVL
jgi:hypothetical protein